MTPTPDPEFDAWVASLPKTHWAKYDLSACRLGWDAARRTDTAGDGCICQGCSRRYSADLLVPDEVWEKISPAKVGGFKGGGLLCPSCIAERVVAQGLATALHASLQPAQLPEK